MTIKKIRKFQVGGVAAWRQNTGKQRPSIWGDSAPVAQPSVTQGINLGLPLRSNENPGQSASTIPAFPGMVAERAPIGRHLPADLSPEEYNSIMDEINGVQNPYQHVQDSMPDQGGMPMLPGMGTGYALQPIAGMEMTPAPAPQGQQGEVQIPAAAQHVTPDSSANAKPKATPEAPAAKKAEPAKKAVVSKKSAPAEKKGMAKINATPKKEAKAPAKKSSPAPKEKTTPAKKSPAAKPAEKKAAQSTSKPKKGLSKFEQAFADARKAGKEKFTFNSKSYNTKRADGKPLPKKDAPVKAAGKAKGMAKVDAAPTALKVSKARAKVADKKEVKKAAAKDLRGARKEKRQAKSEMRQENRSERKATRTKLRAKRKASK